ncbi:AraC family transcriptional regulator [Silvibacterium dinghuense]|uniref:AraC family transcriptional regulator n=1 Tax=Silvibacterium dinghuense TaxID=1560006 RepID=A0A4Q1SIF5_9BACT|nr:AraC family transcriptional regulator [Silvibacterium dinghuense]RXS97173.1 AraC family transcriptional regulator [Silvibacterium dinghuense]GGG96840.1 AraC family transcriptional regulator [Silvibacterium dinghuense]
MDRIEDRISVIRQDRMVPLLPGRPEQSSAHLPWRGLTVEKHLIGAVEIPEHEHTSLCLHLQTSAPVEMEWWSEGRHGLERTGPGSLTLLDAGTRDRLRWGGGSRRLVVSVDPSLVQRAAQELHLPLPAGMASRWNFEDRQLRLLLTEIDREMSSGWGTGALYGDLLGMSLTVALLRKYGAPRATSPQGNRHQVRRVLEFIREHSHDSLRLEQLAEVAGMSVFHFARIFREATGLTPHRYVLEERIRRAGALLERGSRSMAEVAAETGFATPQHFARAFRSVTGLSPSAWRQQRG